MSSYPKVEYAEEGMRDGIQIEDAGIPVEDKLRLLDALGETGLEHIVVGSFVNPRWTPQMACMDELMKRFTPKPGVKYTALLMNEQAVERAKAYSPPLTIEGGVVNVRCHLCDVFVRRNTNRSQAQEMERWPQVVARAREAGVKEARIGMAAAFGSNWLGEFSLDDHLRVMEQQHRVCDEAGLAVTHVRISDEMSWTMPHRVEELLEAIKKRWPKITNFNLHFHNGRGMALVSIYAALKVLEPTDTAALEGALGGIGGCPYCGNGRATGLPATEDLLHMLEAMGIETGVDFDKLIDCVWLLEEIVGHPTFGHVSKAGALPRSAEKWYPMDLPFIETLEQAKHFKLGPQVYQGAIYPWKEPIHSLKRPNG